MPPNDACDLDADLSKITERKMELPDHILKSIHDTDSLKKYVGIYKQLNSYPFNFQQNFLENVLIQIFWPRS